MIKLFDLLSSVGAAYLNLSERKRRMLILGAFFLLAGLSVRKLVISVEELQKPRPAADPEELLKPMQAIIDQTKGSYDTYHQAKARNTTRLDSLGKLYFDKNPKRHDFH